MTYDDLLDARERESYGEGDGQQADGYRPLRTAYRTHGGHGLAPADVRGDPPARADEPHLAPGESLFFG